MSLKYEPFLEQMGPMVPPHLSYLTPPNPS